jgi:hypothetical protein
MLWRLVCSAVSPYTRWPLRYPTRVWPVTLRRRNVFDAMKSGSQNARRCLKMPVGRAGVQTKPRVRARHAPRADMKRSRSLRVAW